jgi:hypothetical protein
MILGVAVLKLWGANREERDRHMAEEIRNRNDFASLLKAEQDRHQKEEDEIRSEYISTLKSLSGTLRGDPHA